MSNSATETLGLDFEVNGLSDLLKMLDRIATAAKPAGKALRQMLGGKTNVINALPDQQTTIPITPGNINIVIKLPAGYLRNPGGGASSSGAVARKARQAGVYGLAQRHRDLALALNDPALKSDSARYQDTLNAYKKTKKQMEGSSTLDRVITAVRSTRLNAGPVSPLIGRSMDALSGLGIGEELTGPIGLAATAAAAAGYALWNLSKNAADLGDAFTKFEYQAGSGRGTSATLMSLGSSIGLSPEAVGNLAQTLQDRITSDPQARAVGLGLGVYNLPGIFGNQDIGQQLTTVVMNLKKITDPTQRLASARTLGLTDVLPLFNLSKRQAAYMQSDASIRTDVSGGDDSNLQEQSADFQAAMGRVSFAFDNLQMAMGSFSQPSIIDTMNIIADLFNGLSTFISDHEQTFKTLFDMFMAYATPNFALFGLLTGKRTALTDLFEDMTGKSYYSDKDQALQDNTAAIKVNSAAIKGYLANPGTYGSMKRDSNTLMPSGVNGQSISQQTLSLSMF